MKSEIKNYYQQHFGTFEPLRLKDIQELCEYELSLGILPEMLYKPMEGTPYPAGSTITRREVRAQLINALKFSRN